MSRKHNTTHPDRGRSNYPRRLEARGLAKAPTMLSLDRLRATQEARWHRAGSPWSDGYMPEDVRLAGSIGAAYGPRKVVTDA